MRRSILTKLAILRRDPTEAEDAVILEYGHTLAHALESVAQQRFTHGECVAIGMCFNARLARKLGTLSEHAEGAAATLVGRLGLPTRLPPDIASPKLLEAMRYDNKRRGESIEFILLEGIGRPHYSPSGYTQVVPDSLILETLEECRGED